MPWHGQPVVAFFADSLSTLLFKKTTEPFSSMLLRYKKPWGILMPGIPVVS